MILFVLLGLISGMPYIVYIRRWTKKHGHTLRALLNFKKTYPPVETTICRELPLVEMKRKMVASLPILLAERTERRISAQKTSDHRERMIATAWKRQTPGRLVPDEKEILSVADAEIPVDFLFRFIGDDADQLFRNGFVDFVPALQ